MNLRVLVSYGWPYRRSLALCSVLMVVEAGAGLSIPWLAGQFASDVLDGRSWSNGHAVLLALLALFFGQALIRFTNRYVLSRTAEAVLADLRIRIYDHLQALPLGFHHQSRKGDLFALLTYEVAQLSGFLTGTLLSVVPLLLTFLGAVVLMFKIDVTLAALVTMLMPVFFFITKIMGRRLRPLATELQEAQSAAAATAYENLGLIPAIKAFTREALESEKHKHCIIHVRDLSTTQQQIHAAVQPAVQFLASAGLLLLLWLASGRMSNGVMTSAELVSFMLYAALLTGPLSALSSIYGKMQMAQGTLVRLQKVLTEHPEAFFEGQELPARVRGAVEFRNVSFSYPDRPPALKGLNLLIRAGETVAITGVNGAGKSTLAHLLMRLHEPLEGEVRIDGIDIAHIRLQSLRSQIGIVPQHVLLLNGSVRDNIAYGKVGAEDAEIEDAARLAQAHNFIQRLPQGYETLIGDQGIRLSGGQRQRLALARALLKDPPILVLDEATAMFDPDGEKAFIADCRAIFAERTVILITHRPASLELAHRVIHMEAGQVVQVSDNTRRSYAASSTRAF